MAASMIEVAEAAFDDVEHRSAHIGRAFTGPRTPRLSWPAVLLWASKFL